MALALSTLRRPANPQVVDPSTGRMREEWQLYFDQLTTRLNASVGALSTDPAPADAQYIVAATDGTLSAERLATNTATVEWDFATAGQAKANVPSDAFGDVVGPASATDSAVALYDGTTGKLVKNSAITVDGDGNVTVDGDGHVLNLIGPANVGIDIGDSQDALSFISFRTGAVATDYDTRLLASGGTGSDGGGTLNILAATLQHNSVDLLKAGEASPPWTYTAPVTLSGTTTNISTSIPAGVNDIEVFILNPTSASDNVILGLQVGDSGGYETTGYVSTTEPMVGSGGGTSTSQYVLTDNLYDPNGGDVLYGTIALRHYGSNTWISQHLIQHQSGASMGGVGNKTLSDVITQVRVNSSASLTGGTVRLRYR